MVGTSGNVALWEILEQIKVFGRHEQLEEIVCLKILLSTSDTLSFSLFDYDSHVALCRLYPHKRRQDGDNVASSLFNISITYQSGYTFLANSNFFRRGKPWAPHRIFSDIFGRLSSGIVLWLFGTKIEVTFGEQRELSILLGMHVLCSTGYHGSGNFSWPRKLPSQCYGSAFFFHAQRSSRTALGLQ